MRHIGKITVELIKKHLPPEKFYGMFLKGSLAKPSNNGWHAWNGLCPFHDDKRAGSFFINKQNGAFNCFSCNAKGGDIFDFYMQKERLGFKDAFKQLGRIVSCAK